MWLIVVVTVLLLSLLHYFRKRNDVFKRLDIPGPTPTLLLGNLREITKTYAFDRPLVTVTAELLQQWTAKFGKLYGYFEGGTPVMVTSDPDILSEIFVKQFSNFHGRNLKLHQTNPDTANDVNMFLARGTRWKRLRNISNPTFTSLKMKQMYPIISNCVDELINVLDKKCKSREAFNIHAVFQGLSMDVIARTAFGYQTSVQSDPNDKLLELCREILHGKRSWFSKWILYSQLVLPELREFFIRLMFLTVSWQNHPFFDVRERMVKVMEERRKQKVANDGVKDFIQLMLEAETDEDHDSTDAKSLNVENVRIEKKLSTDEIIAQSIMFIVAGYETTSTALGYTVYLLALHPEIQEKVYEEIQNTISQMNDVSYDTIQKLTYTDMVFHEALRLFPIAQGVVRRLCMKSCNINGITVPEGMTIAADLLTLHFNEEYWGADAKEFNPNRFLPEVAKNRHPMAYMPFGAGPRNCIGMRFALLEAKLALCKVLQKYRIKMCPQTKIPKNPKQPSISEAPDKVFVTLEERNNNC